MALWPRSDWLLAGRLEKVEGMTLGISRLGMNGFASPSTENPNSLACWVMTGTPTWTPNSAYPGSHDSGNMTTMVPPHRVFPSLQSCLFESEKVTHVACGKL